MEGSLRTPCLIRWPGQVAPGWVSNEIVHVTDMFTTLLTWAGCEPPGAANRITRTGGFLFWAPVITAIDGTLYPISVISNISAR
jgi:arylsulfatase A-like enzyme